MRRKTLTVSLFCGMMALNMAGTAFAPVMAAAPASKDETVYVSQDADGNVTEVKVTDVLSGISSGTVKDKSNLNEIENTKGTETYTQDADGNVVWQSSGKDITYQGTTDQKLPVQVSISYKLDGKTVTADALAGASGKLEITIRYENNSTYHDTIEAKDTLMTTPFFMLSALILDNEKCSNVEVDHGKIVTQGDSTIAIGYGMPGLTKTLKLSGESKTKLEDKLNDRVTITADVTDLELGTLYTVASADLFSEMDLDDSSDDLDELEDGLDKMTDAADKLVDGSSQLANGIGSFEKAYDTYADGVASLYKGSTALAKGTSRLSNGVKAYTSGVTTLKKGTDKYITGTNSLADSLTMYINGEKQAAAGVSALNAQTKELPAKFNAFTTALGQYIDGTNAMLAGASANTLASASEKVAADASSANTMLGELDSGYNDACSELSALASAVQASDMSDTDKAAFQAVLAELDTLTNDTTDDTKASIKNAKNLSAGIESQVATLNGIIAASNATAQSLSEAGTTLKQTGTAFGTGIQGIADGIGAVDSGLATLSQYNDALTSGASALKTAGASLTTGLNTLNKNGKLMNTSTNQLLKGAKALAAGARKLDRASGQIKSGISALSSGASALTKGLSTFKKDGIDKMKSSYDDKLKTSLDRLRSMTGDKAKYDSFSGVSSDMEGSVKFIFQTEEIKK